jgi:predicted nucleic acid-binding protein
VGRRVVGTEQARIDVRRVAQTLDILPIDRPTILQADAFTGSDFEDNIQIAAAATAGLDAIVTRDLSGFASSPISVWSPAELFSRLAQMRTP